MSLLSVAIDVGAILRAGDLGGRAHLVTRPTGRAVRRAIEERLEGRAGRALSTVDLSHVRILDFSCADEVVAKLLQRFATVPGPEVFFVFRGVHEPHRDQVEYVLERQGLAAVAETAPRTFELLGVCSPEEERAWRLLEETRTGGEAAGAGADGPDAAALDALVRRRLAYRASPAGHVHALSELVDRLIGGDATGYAPPRASKTPDGGRAPSAPTHEER